jgi:AcrR family transcriptional regulator
MTPLVETAEKGNEPPGAVAPRERILRAAYELFCRDGVKSTGVDRITAEAGVGKRTLYRQFHSKDELVLAALERREALWTREWLEEGVERRGATGRERLLAVFDIFDSWFRRDDFEGCFFINTVLEMHDDDPPSRLGAEGASQLANIRVLLRRWAEEAGVRDPDGLARQWQLLMAGSIVAAGAGDEDAARQARDAAALLLGQQTQA